MSHETPRSEESDDSGALHSALNSAFDYVIENRSDYYRKNPSNLPQLDSVSGLISSYTRNNAAISGGASLIPGPLGHGCRYSRADAGDSQPDSDGL